MIATVVTILGSVVASLTAVVLAAYLQQRFTKSEQRREAHQAFITSVGTVITRAVILSEINAPRETLYAVFLAMGPVVTNMFVRWKFEREVLVSDLATLMEHGVQEVLSVQSPLERALPYSAIVAAVEDLQQRALKVKALGPGDVNVACQNVVDCALSLLECAGSAKKVLPLLRATQRSAFGLKLEELRNAVRRFDDLVGR
ncbi:hypothetical protein [Ferrimicrobium sp.]|uniref:hypothetical protein n=1 Tax=Ferrimicrobium sp. TaxID=2926050 RepID=UPI00261F7664|nr:hypothetical protein [Ferrimicrobium sp.]